MKKWLRLCRILIAPMAIVLLLVTLFWVACVPPTRPPDLTGRVISVQPDGDGVQFVIQRLSAPVGDEFFAVRSDTKTRVLSRRGFVSSVAVGRLVQVWHVPGVQFGWPPGSPHRVRAAWVVIEANGR